MNKLAGICAALPIAAAVVIAPTATTTAWTPTVSSAAFDLTATVYAVGGAGWETVDEPLMRAILGSRFDKPENTFVNIEWPAYLGTLGNSVDVASDDLYAKIMATEGPQIAIGVSGSTFVMNEVMRRLANDPNPDKPTPEDISFVIIGDGERGLIPAVVPLVGPALPLVSYTTRPIPVTPYDAIVVKGEYDGLADWPDRPWNLLAVINAWFGSPAVEGFGSIHWDSIWVDLDTLPAENITTEVNRAGGTTTTYLVPTPELPLLYPLRGQGVPEDVISLLNSVLKPIVDAGYSRNDPAWLTSWMYPRNGGLGSAPRASRNAVGAPTPASASAALPAAGEPAANSPAVDVARALRTSDRRVPAPSASVSSLDNKNAGAKKAPAVKSADGRRAATGRAATR
jgi:hypothetical protein